MTTTANAMRVAMFKAMLVTCGALTASKGDKASQHAMLDAVLETWAKGTLVTFAYHAGRPASERAKREAAPAIAAGQPAAMLYGRLHSVTTNKAGQKVVKIIALNRRSETGDITFRAINVNVGDLTGVQVHFGA